MKKVTFIFLLSLFSCHSSSEKKNSIPPKPLAEKNTIVLPDLQEGDILFQSTSGGQGKAIQLATNSTYSHVGILYMQGSDYFVFEAVQPVKITPLEKWINRGDNGHYVIKRLKDSKKYLTVKNVEKMKRNGSLYLGKNYDLYFEWSDEKIYCSELVWKVYKQSLGLELGKLQKLKDFDLNHSVVQYKLKERYGNDIPYEEKVISPAAIFESELLTEIFRN